MQEALTQRIREKALAIGFDSVGVCPAVTPTGIHRLHEWLERGYAGEMRYFEDRLEAYENPELVLPGARSIVMLALHYRTSAPEPPKSCSGRVARYAWGEADYHDVIHRRLKALVKFISKEAPGSTSRGVVDSAPVMEHQFAELSGLGWIGKNTLLLNREHGSYFFLAAVLTDLVLQCDEPNATDHCGTCTACLDACPTDAFPEPYVLDARRCISYLTIELRSPIDADLRSGMGDWLFGCDICQEVCPWNGKAPDSAVAEFRPRDDQNPMELISLFEMDDEGFRARFRKSPIWRTKRSGLLRNAAIVLGNQADERAIPALVRGLQDHEPLVRGACVWALRQFECDAAKRALDQQEKVEGDSSVLAEYSDL